MAPSQCCVIGCTATSETHKLFHFPKNDYWRRLWITILTHHNPVLNRLPLEQLKTKRVCEQHFDENQLTWHGRRSRYSYPTLFNAKEKECTETKDNNVHPEQKEDGPEEPTLDPMLNHFNEQDHCLKHNESSHRESSQLSIFSVSGENNFMDFFEQASSHAGIDNEVSNEMVVQIVTSKGTVGNISPSEEEDIMSTCNQTESSMPAVPDTKLYAAIKRKYELKKSLTQQMLNIVSENLSDRILLKLDQVQAKATKRELMLRFQQCFEQACRDFFEYADHTITAKETINGPEKHHQVGRKKKKFDITVSHEYITFHESAPRSAISIKKRSSRKKSKAHRRKTYRSAADVTAAKKKRHISSGHFMVHKKADSPSVGRKQTPARSASPRHRSKSPGKRSSVSGKRVQRNFYTKNFSYTKSLCTTRTHQTRE